MAIDVTALVGSAQVAGTQVSPRGFGKKAMKGYAGMYVGGAVGAAISARGQQKAGEEKATWAAETQTPKFGAHGFLALTEDELTLVKMKQGLASLKPVEVIARVPRSDVATIELGGGVPMSALTVSFANGESWQLEVPMVSKGKAKNLVGVLCA
jgi:hypothetical protein